MQPLLPGRAGSWQGSVQPFTCVLEGSRNTCVSRFFPDSQTHPLHQPEEFAASLEEAVAAGVLGCPPGTSKVGLFALPAPLQEEPQTQGLTAVAEQTPMKSKCKEQKAPNSHLLGRSRNVVGSKEYKQAPEVVESEESQPPRWLTERACACTKWKCRHSPWQTPTKVWVVAESVL